MCFYTKIFLINSYQSQGKLRKIMSLCCSHWRLAGSETNLNKSWPSSLCVGIFSPISQQRWQPWLSNIHNCGADRATASVLVPKWYKVFMLCDCKMSLFNASVLSLSQTMQPFSSSLLGLDHWFCQGSVKEKNKIPKMFAQIWPWPHGSKISYNHWTESVFIWVIQRVCLLFRQIAWGLIS